jgi:agmatinase
MKESSACEEVEVTMVDPPRTMFGVPRWEPQTKYDVVFVGVPTDSGGFGNRTPAAGPGMLRGVSHLFPFRTESDGAPAGWIDFNSRRTILKGIRMADAGDFPWQRRRGAEQFDALPAVYETLRHSARLVVILGGDHSNALSLGKTMHDEGLVWVDAHDDASGPSGAYPHCGNVTSYLEKLPNLPLITQYGVRGLVPATRSPAPQHRVLCAEPQEIVDEFRARGLSRAVVSIDVDVLDPSIMPAVGSMMPGGLQVQDLERLLRELRCGGLDISVLDIAEFAPTSEADTHATLLLTNFFLRAVAICLERA